MSGTNAAFLEAFTATPSLPELGPGPRPEVRPLHELTRQLDLFFREHAVHPGTEPAYRSAALLWHDYLDESHTLSQNLPIPTGSFLHGIMHRREPDYSNAKYWFRRVGEHPAFSEIARKVAGTPALAQAPDPFRGRLAQGSAWDPFQFVDWCEEAALLPKTDPVCRLLQEIQAIEFRALVATL